MIIAGAGRHAKDLLIILHHRKELVFFDDVNKHSKIKV